MKIKVSTFKFLYNPFVRYAGGQAVAYGIAISLLAAVLASVMCARFDGILDVHFVASPVSLSLALIDQGCNALTLSVVFYSMALAAGARHTRFVDIVGTLLLARAPFVFVPLLNATGTFSDLSRVAMAGALTQPEGLDLGNLLFIIPLSLLMLLLVVWMVALMYHAYRVSTHLKSTRLVLSFIVAIILAEALSKYLLYLTHTFVV
jgi:hypothetical protein